MAGQPGQHASLFSYNLSRPYPVRWFTPATIIGGIIVTALVSFISVGTSGYQLISISSINPNATISSHHWFGGLGSYLGSMQATCNSAILPVNSVIYTNNTALPYTITKVTRVASDGTVEFLESLEYSNNPLRNCSVLASDLSFTSVERNANEIAAYPFGLATTTYVSCIVDNIQGSLIVNLTAAYDKYAQPVLPGRNVTSKPSLLWAESVISNWWATLLTTFDAANTASDKPIYKGRLSLSPFKATYPTSADQIKSPYMLAGNAYFVGFSNGTVQGPWSIGGDNITYLAKPGFLDPLFYTVWSPADYLAKGLYYTVLSDLGQTDLGGPNVFSDPELLAYFTKNFTSMVAADSKLGISWAAPYGGLPGSPFDPTSAEASTLRINPSVLATEYLCQSPQRKPAGSLIIAVLVADLVLLKTIWAIYKFMVDMMLQKKYPEMKFCEGCLARHEEIGETSAIENKLQTASPRGGYQKIHISEHSSSIAE